MKTVMVIGGSKFHEQDKAMRRLLIEAYAKEKGFKIVSMEEAEECGLISGFAPPPPLDLKSFPELSGEIPIVKFIEEVTYSNRAARRKNKFKK